MKLFRYLMQPRLFGVALAGSFLALVLWGLGRWLALTHVALAWLLLPAWLLLAFVMLLYGFAIIEASALGRDRAPALDAELIVGREHGPGLRFCALGAVLVSAWYGLDPPPIATAAIGLVTLAWLPAGIALLALEGSLRRALDPRVVLGFAGLMGWRYASMAAVLASAAAVAVRFHSYAVGSFLAQSVLLVCFFAVARVLGRQIFARRRVLDLGVLSAAETLRERREAEEAANWKSAFDAIHLASRSGRIDEADAMVRQAVAGSARPQVALRWFFEELRENGHALVALRTGRQLAGHAARAGNAAAALEACEWCISQSPEFVLDSPATTLLMARAAESTSRYRLAAALLEPFAAAFPASPEAGAAMMLGARLAVERLDDPARAGRNLEWLSRHAPGVTGTDEFARIRDLVARADTRADYPPD